MKRTIPLFFAAMCLLLAAVVTLRAEPTLANGANIPDQYIIKVRNDLSVQAAAQAVANAHGANVSHVYGHALHGFAAKVPPARLAALQADPNVVSVIPDQVFYLNAPPCGKGKNPTPCPTPTPDPEPTPPPSGGDQIIPEGILRVNGDLSSTAAGDGTGSVDVDVAIIDSGISDHPDLNIAGGVNFTSGPSHRYSDGNGHGTHVAGTVGAIDNGIGVVGVAPGARLWGLKVCGNSGSCSLSAIIGAIDWVTANADIIEVANMSLGGSGSELGCNDGGYQEAICNSVAAGVTYVVAAGNESTNAATKRPASFDQVITVSALADFDGEPGGLGSPTCRSDVDDTFANFSNYGADVDIIAPGVCILSTWNDGGYNSISGTSMASPHVAGAAALYKANNPNATPAQVQNALQNSGNFDWNNVDDGDNIKEPLLDVTNQ